MLTLGRFQLDRLAAQLRREIAQAVVVDQRDDCPQLGMLARHLERGNDVAARRDAAEDAFFARQPLGHGDGLVGRGQHDAVEQADVEHGRDEAVADALDLVHAPGAARQQRALGRLDGIDLDRGFRSRR